LVAVAVGLGTIDMPVPSVEEWEWLNWKFPRAVHAGDTIYARWTLTQKRPPIGAAATSIVVWRVDVHTADGALCAEGEVGAKVRRHLAAKDRERVPEAAAASAAPSAAPRRRRRRRPAGANGPVAEPSAPAAPPAPVAKPERAAGAPRRRRRRRPSGGAAARDAEAGGSAAPAAEPAPAAAPVLSTPAASAGGGLGGVIRRLRQPRRT
jgi:hypothetical protein